MERVTEDFRLECIAINRLGKCIAETFVTVVQVPKFDTEFIPSSVRVREGEMIRVELPMLTVGNPEPTFAIFHNDFEERDEHQSLRVKDNVAVFRIDLAISTDAGVWDVSATNEFGTDEISFKVSVLASQPSPSRPTVNACEDRQDAVCLEWDFSSDELPESNDQEVFLVEYFRDQWQLWLNGKYCEGRKCVIADLIPQSTYKFRVRHVSSFHGQGECSVASEPIFIGEPRKFSLQGLPSNDLSRSRSQTRNIGRGHAPLKRSAASLDREVYYVNHDERKEVVTYLKSRETPTTKKYALTEAESDVYRSSLNDLCAKIRKASSIPVKFDSSKAVYNKPSSALNVNANKMTRQEAAENLEMSQIRVKSLQNLLHRDYSASVGSCLETQL